MRRVSEVEDEPLLGNNSSKKSNHLFSLTMSTASSVSDPFYAVRDSVNIQVERIKSRYEKFQDLLANVDTSISVEFKELRKGLTKDVKSVSVDIKGLQGALSVISDNRGRFAHITDEEFESRQKFISGVQSTISELRAGLESPAVRRKIESDEAKARRNQNQAFSGSPVNLREQENSRFIQETHQTTTNILLEQDMALDNLNSAVDRLERIGREVNVELKEQNLMLTQLDDDLDDAGNKMNFVMAKLAKLLKTKDSCQIWTIVILFFVLLILIALVIWAP